MIHDDFLWLNMLQHLIITSAPCIVQVSMAIWSRWFVVICGTSACPVIETNWMVACLYFISSENINAIFCDFCITLYIAVIYCLTKTIFCCWYVLPWRLFCVVMVTVFKMVVECFVIAHCQQLLFSVHNISLLNRFCFSEVISTFWLQNNRTQNV